MATFHLDMSEEEVEYLKHKEVQMKIFCTKPNAYYRLITDQITFRGTTANIEYVKRTEHFSDSVRFADLSNWLVGQVPKKYEDKIQRRCQENILAATINQADEYVYIKSNDISFIKLRMPRNTRYRPGDHVRIRPAHRVKIQDPRSVQLQAEKGNKNVLICHVKILNTGPGLRLDNGSVFGTVE